MSTFTEKENYCTMKRFTFALLGSIALALPLQAQKKGKPQETHSADYYIEHYLFDQAEQVLNQDIAKLKRKRQSTADEEDKLQQVEKLRSMMNATEQVTFIDSFVVDKAGFLEQIKLSSESGRICTYASFFNRSGNESGTVYQSELGNKIYFSQPSDNGDLRLYTSDLLGNDWDTPRPLGELSGDEMQNYPFMLSDGITLYYAARGEESIGGYDIFVTRYDSDEKKFLYPENVGMPFNSTANDYLLAIDEFNRLGWFVSDRNQPADKVCIYVFIPNDVRRTYPAEDMDEEKLGSLARLGSIADTWSDKAAVEAARARLNNALTAAPKAARQKDFELVIDDRTVYTLLSDFQSSEARRLAAEWKASAERLTMQKKELQALRERYEAAGETARKQFRQQILQAEAEYEKAETDQHQLEKRIRNTEIRALQP